MLRFGSSLASKVRLPNNRIKAVAGSRLSWRRDYVGDGEDIKFMSRYTKYKTVLAKSMCNEGRKVLLENDELDDTEIRKGVQMAVDSVLENLSCSAQMISTSEAIAQVATTSINGDKDIGALVARTIELVRTAEGHIFITEGKEPCVKLNLYSGVKLDRGYSSSCFVTNKKKKLCCLERILAKKHDLINLIKDCNLTSTYMQLGLGSFPKEVFSGPDISFYARKFSDLSRVMMLLELAARNPRLIIAEDFDDYVLDTIITRKLTAGTKVCAIKTNVPLKPFIPPNCLKAIVLENDTFIFTTRHTVEEIEQRRPDEDKKKFNNELEFVNNMKLSWGSMSRYFLYEEDQTLDLKNPFILIHENKILDKNIFIQAIGAISSNEVKRPLLVVANGVEAEVAGSVVTEKTFFKTKLCFVKPPVFEESWKAVFGENCEAVYEENCKAIMGDIAILTGGRVVTEASNSLYVPPMLGSCKKVKVTNTEMIIHGGSGNQVNIEDRCEQLRYAIEMSTSDYEIKLLEERLLMLSSRVCFLKVGGATTAEPRKKRKRASNALNAAKAAMEEGIVPGGGVALVHASKELDKLQTMNIGEKIGVRLLQHAVKMPMYTIASAAGFQVSVVEKLLGRENPDLGYDPPRDEYVYAIKSAIVDPPLKLIRKELDDVVSYFVSRWCSTEMLQRQKGIVDGL